MGGARALLCLTQLKVRRSPEPWNEFIDLGRMSLQECLVQADRILARGEDELARQRLFVDRPERDRRAESMARHVLETFEHIQSECVACATNCSQPPQWKA
jgi:hypothetical protein